MEADMSPEMASQVLSMLTGVVQWTTSTPRWRSASSRLLKNWKIQIAVEKLLEHARRVAKTDEEQGWARFEALKVVEASLDSYLRLAEETERMEGAQSLSAAVNHYVALLYLAEGQLDEARATAQHALRLRQTIEDKEGMAYGMALLMAVAKRQHDEDTAIAVGTERLELLISMKDDVGQMEGAGRPRPLPGHHR